jgi:hypothetical protein
MIELNKHRRINFYAITNQEEANPAYQKGQRLIKEGNWEYGWYLHELRSLPNLAPVYGVKSNFDKMRVWIPGMNIKGENIVVWCEAGWGDMIQFSRFIPLLKEAGAKSVKLAFPRQILKLLRRLPNHDGFYDMEQEVKNGIRLKVMSLPYCLMEQGVISPKPVEHIYGAEGVFRNPEITSCQKDKPVIGYCYTTTNTSWNMKAKQMPKEIMDKFISEHPEFEWVNLQQEGGYLTSDLWVDTADKVQALDGVISVDSAIAHIAGSVGVPVANLIGGEKLSCWRWYPKGETTYWYDTMKTVWFDKWEDGLNEALKHFQRGEPCNAIDVNRDKRPTKTNTRGRTAGATRSNKRGASRDVQ